MLDKTLLNVHVQSLTSFAMQHIMLTHIGHLQTHILMLKHHVLIVGSTMNFCKMHLRQEALTLCILFLQDAFETGSNNTLEDLNVPLCMVKKSLGYFNEEVLLLGNVIPSSTTKFSVKEHSGEYYACVHVTFTH